MAVKNKKEEMGTADAVSSIYKRMLILRRFEERVKQLYRGGEIYGAIHLYIGQEAIAVGVCDALEDSDCVFSTHRGHGHYLAKTGDVAGAMAELMGRATGCSKGHGGSMHMFDPLKGFMGCNGIVGGGIPLALGAAFAAKYKGTNFVSVSFFGEGASNQGTFHESLNLAALKKLPLIAVCENNRYAATTPVKASTADEDMAKRAAGYNIQALTVDGNDVEDVSQAIRMALSHVRAGKGPFLLDCKTYRVEPHCGIISDSRPDEELAIWRTPEKDPLNRLQAQHPDLLTDKQVARLDQEVNMELDQAVDFARNSPFPSVEKFLEQQSRNQIL
jgi:pyruvate dehydrogenase E1 component alpha subunit